MLGGIAIRFQQGSNTYPFAIFSVKQTQTCATATTNECYTTGITVQVPFEANTTTMNSPTLIVSVNGVDSQSIPVGLAAFHPHLLSNCDSVFATPATTNPAGAESCLPLVTHVDGTLAANLAQAT